MRRAKCPASSGMSSRRSRSAGTATTSNASLSNRSARNRSARTSAGRSAWVAATTRTSTCCGSLPPTRSKVPYSITLSSFSCTAIEAVAISSRNRVPPSASSNRPGRRLVAPVKAPASCPNNSLSSSASPSTAQFSLMKGRSQRAER